MTLSPTAKIRNREILNAAFDDASGQCHVCGLVIDRLIPRSVAWVRIAGDGEAKVKRLFTKATGTQLAAELARCRPVHQTCAEPLPATPLQRRPLLTVKRSPEL